MAIELHKECPEVFQLVGKQSAEGIQLEAIRDREILLEKVRSRAYSSVSEEERMLPRK